MDPARRGVATIRPLWVAESPNSSEMKTPKAPSITHTMKLRSKYRKALSRVGK
jgi:hypothetical protein